jgi:Tripartite tricarboxylate transporter family receptor
MKLPRRQFLHLAVGAAALPAVSRFAWAQAYPTRPVRLIAPFPAGGVVDLFSRLIGQPLSERLGQPVIVENRAGAGGNVGTEAVVRASPDGYTLLLITSTNAINQTLYDKLNFDFVRDIAPVASIDRGIGVLEVHPSFPAKTVPEFIAYVKASPGRVNMASGGIGSSQHVYGELFKMMAGVDMVHVPYRGGGPVTLSAVGAGGVTDGGLLRRLPAPPPPPWDRGRRLCRFSISMALWRCRRPPRAWRHAAALPARPTYRVAVARSPCGSSPARPGRRRARRARAAGSH